MHVEFGHETALDKHVRYIMRDNYVPSPPPSFLNIRNGREHVYIIGDLEGQINMLFNTLLDIGCVSLDTKHNRALKWTSDPDIYVVQCGDQIDAKRIKDGDVHLDLDMLIFTDYLQKISHNHFVSIIGNHELNNAQTYESDNNTIAKNHRLGDKNRHDLFGFNNLLGRVLRNRLFVFRFGNAIFSHAGVIEPHVRDQNMTLDTWLGLVNRMINDPENMVIDPDKRYKDSAFYKFVKSRNGVTFTRDYCMSNSGCDKGKRQKFEYTSIPIIPKCLQNDIDFMIKGHDKYSLGIRVLIESVQSVNSMKSTMKSTKRNESVELNTTTFDKILSHYNDKKFTEYKEDQYKENPKKRRPIVVCIPPYKNQNNLQCDNNLDDSITEEWAYKLRSDEKCLLISDIIADNKEGRLNMTYFQYSKLESTKANKFNRVSVYNVSCDRTKQCHLLHGRLSPILKYMKIPHPMYNTVTHNYP